MKALLVVAKYPEPGRTKTRLTPPLSPEQAAQFYEALLRDTLDLMRQLAAITDVKPMVAYYPETAEGYFRTLAPDFDLLLQVGNDLGERLDNALTHCLLNGFQQAVIMDSDSPTLPVEFLAQAFASLDKADTVIGPCDDGGYYLIGLKRPAPRLLREVQMSTASVTRDTQVLAADEGLTAALLPVWYDIDTIVELERLKSELDALPARCAPCTRSALLAMSQAVFNKAPLRPSSSVEVDGVVG